LAKPHPFGDAELANWPFAFVPPSGNTDSTIAVIGEAPGGHETAEGRGFVGPSGRVLWHLIERHAHVYRSRCWVSNVCKVRPGEDDDDPSPEMLDYFRPLLHLEIQSLPKLRYVLAVGKFACREFFGPDVAELDMREMTGVAREVEYAGRRLIVVGCMHPAAGLRNPEFLNQTVAGILRLSSVGNNEAAAEVPKFAPGRIMDREDILRLHTGWIAIDTEGTPAHPYCLTWATEHCCGFVAAGDHVGLKCFKAVFTTNEQGEVLNEDGVCAVYMHNATWDLKVLRAMGIDLLAMGIEIHDTMLMSYARNQYAHGLKALAWQRLGEVRKSYETIVEPAYEAQLKIHAQEIYKQHISFEMKPKGRKKVMTEVLVEDALAVKLRRLVAGKTPIAKRLSTLLDWVPPVDYDRIEGFKDYARQDALDTARLAPMLIIPHTDPRHRAYEIAMGALPLLDRMETVGMPFDADRVRALRDQWTAEMAHATDDAVLVSGDEQLNLGSAAQVAPLLIARGQHTGKFTDGGRMSLRADGLATLDQEDALVSTYRNYKELEKLTGAFCDGILDNLNPNTGRLHPRITGYTKTDRLRCEKPNLLAFPTRTERGKMIRECCVAPEGYLLGSWDLSQIELRVLADDSGDEVMIEDFRAGKDKHQATADRIGCSRTVAKNTNFCLVYGGGAKKVSELSGVSEEEAQHVIDSWMNLHLGVAAYMERKHAEARMHGYVTDRYGGRCEVYAATVKGWGWPWGFLRGAGERTAGNFPIQAGAQRLLKIAMAYIWKEVLPAFWKRGVDVQPLLQVHDEIILAFPADVWDDLNKAMLAAMVVEQPNYQVPLLCGSSKGETWGALK